MWRNLSHLKFFRSSFSHRLGRTRSLCAKNGTNRKLTALETANNFKSGDQVGGYKVVKVTPVPELQLVSVQLMHEQTGAEHLHIARQDSNNVFGVGFRTTPMDSTGVPHILEHTVLCGSYRFPCRDPFFNMLNRSLATFMNAFTASDYTMYPFSTQNEKDFNNLLAIYLDAVFFPRLTELDFWQEGWRLEPNILTDPKSPFIFKGVVFNEMKGALSTAESLYLRHAQMKLLPSHTYGNNSGGDPLCIPDLTWEKLKEFHASHYHPSNSRFYTYGDMSLEKHLEGIEEMALRQFDKINPGTDIPNEPRWMQPRYEQVTCPPDPMAADPERQTITSLNYLLGSTLDPFEGFVLSLLSSLLVSGPTSPFYQALIEPNIGTDYSPGVGYDSSTKDPSFSIGLQGIGKADVNKVAEIIQNTFDKTIEQGFEAERIEAALHRVELAVKHQSSNFGLALISSVMSVWNHGGDPAEHLQINKTVDKFKECLEAGPILQDNIKRYFKDNPHCLTLTMEPDQDYEKKQEKEEQEKLKQMLSSLSEKDKTNIYYKDLNLAAEQNSPPDVSVLPRMNLSDIDPKIKPVKFEETVLGGVPVQISEQPTNGMTYFRAISSISDIPDELKSYLPLFCFVLTKMGAGSMNYKEMAQQIELATGGLSVSTHVCSHHTHPDTYEQGVTFSSYCLDKNLPRMFYLWEEIFARPNLTNKDRLRTLINMVASDMSQSIAYAGHSFALSLAESSLTPSGKLGEKFGGLSQVMFMKELAETEDLEPVIEKLSAIALHVLDGSEFRCAVNMTNEAREPVLESLVGFLDTLNADRGDMDALVKDSDFRPLHEKVHFEMPFPVNYVTKCLTSVQYNHEDFPRLRVLAKILSSKFLHREIREKGGAYGSGAKIGGGTFSFYSYRDPNSVETLNAFDESVKWAAGGKFSDEDITEAKLSVFASVDKPISPSNRGMAYFSQRITDEMRQTHRDGLFKVTRDDLVMVAQRYLSNTTHCTNSVALLGPRNESLFQDKSWRIRTDQLG